jgi:flavin reductase (DIM6/NTAB) family NADH-FMN oxidoreductase RutF
MADDAGDAARPRDAAQLRERLDGLLTRGDSPVFVVTTRDETGRRAGCLIGFATQCGIDPPRFAAWISVNNHTYEVACRATHLAVHVLAPQQRALGVLFGSVTGHDRDKFAECAWSPGPHGLPVLDDVAGWFAGPFERHAPSGDHALFVVAPDVVEGRLDGRPLSFQDVKNVEAGNPA